MQRSAAFVRGGISGLVLAVAITVLPGAATSPRPHGGSATRPILFNDPEVTRQPGAAMPPAGIRSYGVGADRLDIEREAVPAPRPAVESIDEAWLSGPPVNLAGLTRKISGSPMAGSVTAFRVSPNGAIAVFIADKDTLGRFELYSAPVNGSAAPVKLSAGLPFGSGDAGVAAFQISPDSARVVFLADPNTGSGVNEIFSAPIGGSAAPVQLNTAGAAPVGAFGITPDGTRAVFFGTDTSFGSSAVELYRAAIGSAFSAVQLSDVGQGNPQGDVVSADFSPDSARAIYAADATADSVFQWHSVPLAAAGPGSDVQLSTALKSVGLVRVSPDSSRVVYTGDENVLNRMEVFARPIGGGARVQLNPSMAGDGATAIRISPNGSRVAYLADQHTAGVNEVYSAQILVGGSGTRLNPPMSGSQYADTLIISPDSTTAVYEADQNTPGTYELYRAPMDATSGSSTLHAVTPPGNAGSFLGLGTPIIGKRVVYPMFGSAVDLFSVPFNGTAPFIQINGTLAAGDTLFNVFLPTSATRLMAYGSGPASGSATNRVIVAAIRSDLPAEQINLTAAAGARGVLGYEITSEQAYGVYLQDQDTSGKPELYSRELDSDADGVVNVTDNCPFVVNPSQGPLVFPATVDAVSITSFTWNQSLDVRFARGPLASVGSLATDATGTLVEAAGHVDPAIPAVGSGWYYLFALDCPGRSYQTTPGAEPGRDLAGLP